MLNFVQNSLNVCDFLLQGQGPSGDQLALRAFTENDLLLQYAWNENEMFLFRAVLAFAMRNHLSGQEFK